MPDDSPTPSRNTLAVLRRFARPRAAEERCDLCAAPLAEEHTHLLEPATRQLQCTCDACAILFDSTTPTGKYRRVPRTIERWSDFVISDEQWEALGVPIALSFFFFSTPLQHIVTMYPSPGGATEAALSGDVWQLLCQDNAELHTLLPDVEALLVNRMRGAREYYRVSIDHCFKLVGLIRTHWRGLSGGPKIVPEVTAFFENLKSRSSGATIDA
jgi:hypothetical protein